MVWTMSASKKHILLTVKICLILIPHSSPILDRNVFIFLCIILLLSQFTLIVNLLNQQFTNFKFEIVTLSVKGCKGI